MQTASDAGMAGFDVLDGFDVFDVHQHHGTVAHSAVAGAAAPTDAAQWLQAEVAARVSTMDRLGIGRTLVLPGNSYLRPDGLRDTCAVNDAIARYCAADPTRFAAGAGVVEPLYGAAGLAEVRRIAELGLVGVSYHARFQGVATDDAWIHRHLELMPALGLVPFVHCYADSTLEAPVLVGNLARAHPELTIVVLDGMSTYHHTLECIALAERHPNLVFDSAMAFNASAIGQFVRAVGAGRLLFGSDIYSYPNTFVTSNTPAALRAGGLNTDELRAILGGNLARLLGSHGRTPAG
ncbi:amidohydrolase family protein [Jatrophihabitans cynanchi]|jgi:predicted TIM-barrel fold metal-dependent hydrolase|uniref:Amidohydrolase family protein n=1 Tax=Jatrophihabitans cynanchi TaxID=2944128 RepID=A0ABY7JUP1_9ACTN|nr:amidohydrolase family protein [Jatrophihabitans sp. SB3-54]WAX56260.1 amidohydrolase family protein [Jatrophihabitans sp. SB3-54]